MLPLLHKFIDIMALLLLKKVEVQLNILWHASPLSEFCSFRGSNLCVLVIYYLCAF